MAIDPRALQAYMLAVGFGAIALGAIIGWLGARR